MYCSRNPLERLATTTLLRGIDDAVSPVCDRSLFSRRGSPLAPSSSLSPEREETTTLHTGARDASRSVPLHTAVQQVQDREENVLFTSATT
jgi:hypothetical protein